MATPQTTVEGAAPRVPLFYDPRVRGIAYQVLVFAGLIARIYWIIGNTTANLQRANIASGFAFLQGRAGFDIGDSLVEYSSDSTYGRALFVGFLNTLRVAVVGIITATIIGFIIGIGRLSKNWLINRICLVYVEVFRNIPPLLVIFFWYFGVLSVLPLPRDSIGLPLGSYLNSRGFYFPRFLWGEGAWLVLVGLVLGIVFTFFVRRWAHRRQMATGEQFPVFWTGAGLIVGLPLLAFV
ncbi:MAG: ABC transporter permease subunit, partial [Nitratireductor sp.]